MTFLRLSHFKLDTSTGIRIIQNHLTLTQWSNGPNRVDTLSCTAPEEGDRTRYRNVLQFIADARLSFLNVYTGLNWSTRNLR